MLDLLSTLSVLKVQEDPEAMFDRDGCSVPPANMRRDSPISSAPWPRAITPRPTLAGGRQFDALRRNADFQALVAQAETGRRQALAAFREAGGERLLGR